MSTVNDETWLFVVEWFDPMPQLKRKYLLKYFVKQNQAEMIDLKSKKLFLKKSHCPPELGPEDFYIGSKVLIYSRELEIVDFGDEKTREKLQHQSQQSIIILPPESYPHWGKILNVLFVENSFNLFSIKSFQFPVSSADLICDIVGASIKQCNLKNGVSMVVVVQAENGIAALVEVAEGIQKQFSTKVYVANNGSEVNSLQSMVISNGRIPNSVTLDSCTCCIIKPHAVKAKQMGNILDLIISQGYDVSAISTVNFDKLQAEEFLEVYKGVVPEYSDQVLQLCSSLAIAMEIRAEDAVSTFRQTAGPWNVAMAKELRPGTIRALYGIDAVKNAVHCTDLDSDGVSECEYCFQILGN